MATIGGYINAKFSKFRVNLDASELEVLLINNDLNGNKTYVKEDMLAVEKAIINIIPELLLSPDKTTGDTSLKWDRTAIYNYYKLRCAELGLPDLIAGKESSIGDLSNIW